MRAQDDWRPRQVPAFVAELSRVTRTKVGVKAVKDKDRRIAEELRRLLRKIQKLPEAIVTSEDQIAEEIAEYRAGR